MNKEKIIAFLEGTLSEEERAAIVHKQAEDTSFAEEVAAVKEDWEMVTIMGRAYLKSKMKEWEQPSEETNFFSSKEAWEQALDKEADFLQELEQSVSPVASEEIKVVSSSSPIQQEQAKVIPIWRKYVAPLSIAASFLLLFSIGLNQWAASFSNESLTTAYFEKQLTLNAHKGEAVEDFTEEMKRLIQKGDFVAAKNKGEESLPTLVDESKKIQVNYLLGQVYYRQKDYPNAIRYFEAVESMAIGSIRKEVQLNTIILYLLEGDENQALTKLQNIKEKERNNLGIDDLKKLEELESKIKHPLRSWAE